MTIETDRYPVDDRGFTDNGGGGKYLDLSPSKMNKDRHFGTGPEFVKFGKAVRYSYAALDAWAAKHRQTCTREVEAA